MAYTMHHSIITNNVPKLLKFALFMAVIFVPAPYPVPGIVVKDYATSFVVQYNELLNPTPESVGEYAISYELKNKDLFYAAYYSTMSEQSIHRVFNAASMQYVSINLLIPKYIEQIKNIKKLTLDLEARYKKILGVDLNFEIYLWSSLVDTDGSTFIFNGKPVFAINLRLAANYSVEQLKILLAHEAFHLYQMQNLKKPSTQLSLIEYALWSEGWATYISSVIYPGLHDWNYVSYYQQNDSEYKEYTMKMQQILEYIDKNLHSNDPEIFGKLFSAYKEMSEPLPPRSGIILASKWLKNWQKTKIRAILPKCKQPTF